MQQETWAELNSWNRYQRRYLYAAVCSTCSKDITLKSDRTRYFLPFPIFRLHYVNKLLCPATFCIYLAYRHEKSPNVCVYNKAGI